MKLPGLTCGRIPEARYCNARSIRASIRVHRAAQEADFADARRFGYTIVRIGQEESCCNTKEINHR